MTAPTVLKRGGVTLGSIGAAALLYQLWGRRRILNWGATAAEAEAQLPGDELLEHADGAATRAITIDAPASAVWPWIAQMGPSPRGGAYTYDWIENLLGLDMHSADHVLPEYQHPQVGDTLGYGKNPMRFERVEPERVLATRSDDGNWVWELRPRQARRKDTLDQPQPLRAPDIGREDRDAPDGACVARHGAQDDARGQATRPTPCRRLEGGGTCLRALRPSRPTMLA
jgi:hypothetical protein